MFKKLRNKFIITNIIITTIILLVAFVSVFFTAAAKDGQTPPVERARTITKDLETREMFEREIEAERSRHLTNLAFTLVIVGVSAELLVFLASYYIAEKSIKPVKDAYRKQQEFIANASHELKTPIAAAQANFEALSATEKPWADNVEMELGRAAQLVNDMLTLTRMENGTVPPKLEETDLGALVEKRANLMEPRLNAKSLKLKIPHQITTKINSDSFSQIADILIDNAIKYSDKRIEIILDEHSLIVRNDGKGIPKEKLPHIFDRFYQVDKTSTGVGLGLSIAKSVADNNGWVLSAKSEKKRTEFVLKFN